MSRRVLLGLLLLAGLGPALALGSRGLVFESKAVLGERGRGRTELKEPVDVCVTAKGDVAVLDRSREAVVMFSALGTWLRTVGGDAGRSPAVALRRPEAMAGSPRGDLWVADTGNHRLVVLGEEGDAKRVVGGLGSSEGRFRLPSDLAFDRSGTVYVADRGNDRIQILGEDGSFRASWDRLSGRGHDRIIRPKSLAYSDYARGAIWVVNDGSARLECLSVERAGEWASGVDLAGLVDGTVQPEKIEVEPTFYRMFVADSAGKRVLVVSRSGDLLGEIRGADNSPFVPGGLCVTRLLEVLVAEPSARRVHWFQQRLNR